MVAFLHLLGLGGFARRRRPRVISRRASGSHTPEKVLSSSSFRERKEEGIAGLDVDSRRGGRGEERKGREGKGRKKVKKKRKEGRMNERQWNLQHAGTGRAKAGKAQKQERERNNKGLEGSWHDLWGGALQGCRRSDRMRKVRVAVGILHEQGPTRVQRVWGPWRLGTLVAKRVHFVVTNAGKIPAGRTAETGVDNLWVRI